MNEVDGDEPLFANWTALKPNWMTQKTVLTTLKPSSTTITHVRPPEPIYRQIK